LPISGPTARGGRVAPAPAAPRATAVDLRLWRDPIGEKIEARRQEIEAIRQKIEARRQWIEAERQRLEARRQEIEALRQEIEALRQEIEDSRQEIEARRREYEARLEENTRDGQQIAAWGRQIEAAAAQIEEWDRSAEPLTLTEQGRAIVEAVIEELRQEAAGSGECFEAPTEINRESMLQLNRQMNAVNARRNALLARRNAQQGQELEAGAGSILEYLRGADDRLARSDDQLVQLDRLARENEAEAARNAESRQELDAMAATVAGLSEDQP
jgi:chromosome segregation ATPase